ncbi:phosphotransferase family protein [Amycolatopsis suaedae]|uniref:phosphotransferase family protein n=1 Tax=Amycolatopsis suaedae TaxID=2510978 RepID=UPI0013EF0102|nr:aminoglycoside phosphotransferase family protein [Amycolatopsis suaedae]
MELNNLNLFPADRVQGRLSKRRHPERAIDHLHSSRGAAGQMRATSALTPESAHAAMKDACRQAGIDSSDARLVRTGENVMFQLGDVMVRVGRSRAASGKEVAVARWLSDNDFPAVRIVDSLPQPVVADNFAVTFWEYISEVAPRPTSRELAAMLRSLHDLPSPPFRLPLFEPLAKIENRLSCLPADYLNSDDLQFVMGRKHELAIKYNELKFSLSPGVIHGDAHTGNLMRDRALGIRLIDFEDFAVGPREWDVSILAVRYQAFGWVGDVEYAEFTNTYGFDPTDWSGFPIVRSIRELNMTTWLMQQAGQSREIDEEISVRLRDLRDDQRPRRWRVF